jgi:hypothetical protein
MGYFQNQFPDQPAKLSEPASAFVKRWWEGFRTKGNVDDDPKPGRPPKIPDIKAREAAEIICRGYPVRHTVHQQVVTDVKYFYSVAEAIAYSATLRDTLRDYKATPGAAYSDAMHRAAPSMVRRRVTFRHHLAEDEEAKRQRVAADLLVWLHNDPLPPEPHGVH